jgi:transcriptional regulator with XRE-family HTH domain
MPDWVQPRRRQIGERIRTARLHANLTQEKLGERIGRDHKTVHRYETAQSVPTLVDMLLLADALDVPLADLVEGPAAGTGDDAAAGPGPSPTGGGGGR